MRKIVFVVLTFAIFFSVSCFSLSNNQGVENEGEEVATPCFLNLSGELRMCNMRVVSDPNSIFVGHAYGLVNYVVPNPGLKALLRKHIPEDSLLVLGGDVTFDKRDFNIFHDSIEQYEKLYVRGNHDGNLWDKVEYWENVFVNEFNFVNIDLDKRNDGQYELPIIPSVSNDESTVYLSHQVWFHEIFSPLPLANTYPGTKDIRSYHLGENNIYIAGDCGAFAGRFPYALTTYAGNTFVCSGIGSEENNHIVSISNLEPAFFDNQGDLVNYQCGLLVGDRYNNKIIVCFTDRALVDVYKSLM